MTLDERRMQFFRIAQENKSYTKALEILKESGSDFTIYSCTNEVIADIVSGKDLEKVIERVNLANNSEIHISEIRMKKESVDHLKAFFDAFDNDATKERLFVLLGETGVGKSYVIEERYPQIAQYACNKSLDTYSLCYYLADNGSGLTPHATPFLKALTEGGKVFLDEMNDLPHETLMFIQGITDEKKSVVIGDKLVQISPKFKILAAMNPPSETDERTPLGDALLSRSVGYVMELTDEIIIKRIGKSKAWLTAVRKLYNFVAQSGLIDMRELSFRDYQRLSTYDFETQFKFKVCMGDVSNIKSFTKITSTGEYDKLIGEIENAR